MGLAVLPQKIAKGADMFLQTNICQVATIARKDRGLWQCGRSPLFVRIAEKEFACFDGRPGARRRFHEGSFDHGLREPIVIAKVFVRVAKRR